MRLWPWKFAKKDAETSPATPDVEGLKEFEQGPDRGKARFFEGRRRELAHVERLFRQAEAGSAADATTVFRGAAGAGKSALLEEIRAMAESRPGVTFLKTRPECLADEAKLTAAIARAVHPDAARRMRETVTLSETAGGSVGVGAPLLKGEAREGTSRESSTAPLPATLASLAQELRAEGVGRAVCLCIDEVQFVPPKPAAREILRALHEGETGMTIVPVYAGLANSTEALEAAGLCRTAIGNVFTLGGIGVPGAERAAERFLDEFRVDCRGADRKAWASWVAGSSFCWAQHVQSCLQSLAGELWRNEGILARVDRSLVESRTAQRKLKFYKTMRGHKLSLCRVLVSSVMNHVRNANPDSLAVEDILALIEREASDMPGRQLPEDRSPRAFLSHLTEKGALYLNEADRWECPVPTYHDFLVRQGQRAGELQKAVQNGDMERVRDILAADPSKVDREGPMGRTALHDAAKGGHREILRLLLAKGSDAAKPDENGATPMHEACANGHPHAATMIAEAGGFSEARRLQGGNSVLHDAALSGSVGTVDAVLGICGNPDMRNHDCDTPLHLAAGRGLEAVAGLLAERGADMAAKNEDGLIPSEVARLARHEAVSRLLESLAKGPGHLAGGATGNGSLP